MTSECIDIVMSIYMGTIYLSFETLDGKHLKVLFFYLFNKFTKQLFIGMNCNREYVVGKNLILIIDIFVTESWILSEMVISRAVTPLWLFIKVICCLSYYLYCRIECFQRSKSDATKLLSIALL